MKYFLRLGLLVGAFLVLVVSPVEAATETKSYERNCAISSKRTDWTDQCKLEKFDTRLGVLKKVTLRFKSSIEGVIKIENKDAAEKSITANYQNSNVLKNVGGDEVMAVPSTLSFSDTLPTFDGTVDFAGDSGRSSEQLRNSESKTVVLTDTSALRPFIDTDIVTFLASATGATSLSGSANAAADWDTYASAELTATYEYEKTVPSPTPAPSPSAVPKVAGTRQAVRGVQCQAASPTCVPAVSSVRVDDTTAVVTISGCEDMSQCAQVQLEYGSCAEGFGLKETIAVGDGSSVTHTVSDLDSGSLYHFRARCLNECAVGDYGESIAGITREIGESCPYVYSGDVHQPVSDQDHEACDLAPSIEPVVVEGEGCAEPFVVTKASTGAFWRGFLLASLIWILIGFFIGRRWRRMQSVQTLERGSGWSEGSDGDVAAR